MTEPFNGYDRSNEFTKSFDHLILYAIY